MGLIALVMVSCNSKVETKTTTAEVNNDSIKTVIQDMENAYAKAMEEKNIDGIMVYYAENIQSYDATMTTATGFDAVKKSMSEMLAQMPAKFKIKMNTDDLIVSEGGDLVSENGNYVMSDTTGTQIGTGRFLAVFQKKDENYKCVREAVMADMPKKPASEAKKE